MRPSHSMKTNHPRNDSAYARTRHWLSLAAFLVIAVAMTGCDDTAKQLVRLGMPPVKLKITFAFYGPEYVEVTSIAENTLVPTSCLVTHKSGSTINLKVPAKIEPGESVEIGTGGSYWNPAGALRPGDTIVVKCRGFPMGQMFTVAG